MESPFYKSYQHFVKLRRTEMASAADRQAAAEKIVDKHAKDAGMTKVGKDEKGYIVYEMKGSDGKSGK
jgi:hypothetical protein